MIKDPKRAIVALEDGTYFEGFSFGAQGERTGEVVFNTSLTGYQEILTDPSYKGQIVTMTYPLIGNYGINPRDFESKRPWVEGFIVRENSKVVSNWRSKGSLQEFLTEHGIIGIEGVDTRALTMHIRAAGAMKGIISTLEFDQKKLAEKAKCSQGLEGVDLVRGVTCKSPFIWNNLTENVEQDEWYSVPCKKRRELFVVAIDFGIKHNILRRLFAFGCHVKVVPANTRADDILKLKPDGILLSNGPGDPEAVTYGIETTRQLIGKKPVFGICLGHQILGLALGGRTFKLKFGHRGGNQPVKDLKTGKVFITSQNHGFALDAESINLTEVDITHINLNDNTVEGLSHRSIPAFSVQYHPEASPGPHDSDYLFSNFIEMIERYTASDL